MDFDKVIIKQIETLERANELLLPQVADFYDCAQRIAKNAQIIQKLVSFLQNPSS